MISVKSATGSTKNHPFSPIYLRVQFDGKMPKNYHPFWVKWGYIVKRTGWDKYDLRAARDHGWINYKKDHDGEILYDLHSLSEKFFIK